MVSAMSRFAPRPIFLALTLGLPALLGLPILQVEAQSASGHEIIAAIQRNHQARIMTGVLAAELALTQGEVANAVEAYHDLARLSADARIAERAVELLLKTGDRARADELLAFWARSHPESIRPRLLQLALALTSTRAEAAQAALLSLLALPERLRAEAIMDVARLLAHAADRDLALSLAREIRAQIGDTPEAAYAEAVALTGTNQSRRPEALAAIDRALAARPLWPQAVAVKARLLMGEAAAEKDPLRMQSFQAQALGLLEQAVRADASSRELRELLARALYDANRFAEAREIFLGLAAEGREDADAQRFAAALAAFAARDWATAEAEFERALAEERGEATAIRYYLGRISEAKGDWKLAAERYAQVDRGERAFEAQLRRAQALARDRRTLEAMALLSGLKPGNPRQVQALKHTEIAIWREAREYARALALVEALLAESPDDPDLLYDSAILLEYTKQSAEAERRLRRLIALEPPRAHALNALGYSLADRNERLDEAEQLIQAAYRLAPEDAAIIDSMGWIAYRRGRLEEAERYLREALQRQPDAEVAAHLGEVLWVTGRRDEARRIWQEHLQRQPEHEVLRATIERFEKP